MGMDAARGRGGAAARGNAGNMARGAPMRSSPFPGDSAPPRPRRSRRHPGAYIFRTTGRTGPRRPHARRPPAHVTDPVLIVPMTEGVPAPLVGVIMGSKTDYPFLEPACDLLEELGVPYEARVVSAHRTPDWMFRYAATAEERGLQVIIAAAGGAAHLPGMVAAKTLVPVLGVPVPATMLQGVDALLSIVQMPGGVPVGTLAIGKPGAVNAAILAAEIVGLRQTDVRERLRAWRRAREEQVLGQVLP